MWSKYGKYYPCDCIIDHNVVKFRTRAKNETRLKYEAATLVNAKLKPSFKIMDHV